MEGVSDIGSTPEGSDGEYSLDDDDQLQPEDTLVDRGIDDVLDEGFSPPDYPPSGARRGLTAEEQRGGESLDERLSEEVPDSWNAEDPIDEIERDSDARSGEGWRPHESDSSAEFPEDTDDVGGRRSGRLVAPDEGSGLDVTSEEVAFDVGIDGAGASAEEAAVHIVGDSAADDE